MYGYEIPRYAREYLSVWRVRDRFLRLRWSLDEPGHFILERKTRWLEEHPFQRGTDRQVQLKDDYRKIVTFAPADIGLLDDWLRAHDIQALGGSKALADHLDAEDHARAAKADQSVRDYFSDLSGEAYDNLAWREGRRVAGGF